MRWRKFARGACIAAVFAALAGCGGGSSTAGSSGGQSGGSGGTTIQGIATPSSVAVVTANNAN